MLDKYSFDEWIEATKEMKTPTGKAIDKIVRLNGKVLEDPPISKWKYQQWTLIGFDLPVDRQIKNGEAIFVEYGDLLGPDGDPWRVFERILYLP